MENNKFKVGDRVKCIKQYCFAPVGTTGTIMHYYRLLQYSVAYGYTIKWDYNVGGWGNTFLHIADGCGEDIPEQYIELIPAKSVIFANNKTILNCNGKHTVSTCNADDTFDKEKGVLMCIAKANGYSYEDIKELVKNAEDKTKNKYKITLTEFWNRNKIGKACIRCDTEEKANELLIAFDKLGKKWASESTYKSHNNYSSHTSATCYDNENAYGDYDWFKKDNYKIYEFSEVDLKN